MFARNSKFTSMLPRNPNTDIINCHLLNEKIF